VRVNCKKKINLLIFFIFCEKKLQERIALSNDHFKDSQYLGHRILIKTKEIFTTRKIPTIGAFHNFIYLLFILIEKKIQLQLIVSGFKNKICRIRKMCSFTQQLFQMLLVLSPRKIFL
jgi:hypothetical protein